MSESVDWYKAAYLTLMERAERAEVRLALMKVDLASTVRERDASERRAISAREDRDREAKRADKAEAALEVALRDFARAIRAEAKE